ncbi:hypothetical protein CS022_21120 [Veronia nyctiphanis]|uniref:JmjC domain-containing protein n=1 Tax=Veronia nyctiphanis TaxID=1278244 RepID=A0A4Q0YLM7_9GAMM|nr:hypothetical protein [Veronia nyctiphanis]RXJ71333.1 hypothetical protein CS022_21120 [Veronia nyctiphanis]
MIEYNVSDFDPDNVNLDIPFIVRSYGAHWLIRDILTFENLQSVFKNVVVPQTDMVDKTVFWANIREFFERNRADKNTYIQNWQFLLDLPELADTFVVPKQFRCFLDEFSLNEHIALEGSLLLSWAFIGLKGSHTTLHQDVADTSAWNVSLYGRKSWSFFCPEFNPESDRDKPTICIQNPGDLIYTPANWWHSVENLEATISITQNFIRPEKLSSFGNFVKANFDEDISSFIKDREPKVFT